MAERLRDMQKATSSILVTLTILLLTSGCASTKFVDPVTGMSIEQTTFVRGSVIVITAKDGTQTVSKHEPMSPALGNLAGTFGGFVAGIVAKAFSPF